MTQNFSVAVVGIPVSIFSDDNYWENGSFFEDGLTNRLRSGSAQHVLDKSKENSIKINISDLGELVDMRYDKGKAADTAVEETGRFIPKEVYASLASRLKQIVDQFDFVLVYGGAHNSAFPLYYLKGRVDRFDIHDDAQMIPEIASSSYLWHAIYSPERIKYFRQVSHHGVREIIENSVEGGTHLIRGRDYEVGRPTEDASGQIFDIDIDYFMITKPEWQFEWSLSKPEQEDNRASGLMQAIRTARPKVIGIFEYQRLDGSERGYQRILELAWQGVVSKLNN